MELQLQMVRELLEYNRWANAEALDLAAQLDPEDLGRDLGTSLASVRGTLTHIMWAEWLWVRRWRGESPTTDRFDPAEFPSVEDLRRRWKAIHDEQDGFVSSLSAEQLARPVGYRNFEGERWEYPLWRQVAHLLNHSSYHRGQVATLLRQLGKPARPLDVLVFYDERGGSEPD